MVEVILIEILAVPAERSRGRHNPRVVKRKMSNFPTKSRSAANAAPSQIFRYEEHIHIVAPAEPAPATTALGKRAAPKAHQTQPAPTDRRTFWLGHVQSWRAGGLPRAVYCQQQGLSPQAFNAWVARLHPAFRRSPKAASIPA
jgi:hypothetical protein